MFVVVVDFVGHTLWYSGLYPGFALRYHYWQVQGMLWDARGGT